MKLAGRYLCEGTCPPITIGHRVSRRADGTGYVSRTWTNQYSFEGNTYTESLSTKKKQVAIRRAHEIVTWINDGRLKPHKYKISLAELRHQYLDLKRDENRSPRMLQKYAQT